MSYLNSKQGGYFFAPDAKQKKFPLNTLRSQCCGGIFIICVCLFYTSIFTLAAFWPCAVPAMGAAVFAAAPALHGLLLMLTKARYVEGFNIHAVPFLLTSLLLGSFVHSTS